MFRFYPPLLISSGLKMVDICTVKECKMVVCNLIWFVAPCVSGVTELHGLFVSPHCT